MPFNATLSAGEITQTRRATQAFEHYVLVTPNDIVWQAQINETISDKVYAEFDWTNTLQGNRADVIEGQVLLITDSDTDFSNPIVRGRVRKVPDATDVFINESGINIDTTMYVTIIDDFDIMEKLPRINPALTQLKDWDIAYQELPPLIAGLQSAYVDFSGDNPVAFSFSPTAAAIESGASISTWSWDIDDGSFTGGTSSSDQNIQCTFPGESVNEHRWVHLTVTDDNGISSDFHFQVFTVDKNSSSAVLLDSGELTITGSIEDGWNTTISAWDGVGLTEILDQTRVVIASIDTYDVAGTPTTTAIVSNIRMVGRLRNESSVTTTDEQASVVPVTDFTVEGFATQLARLPFLPQQVLDDDTPTAWGDITDPDPVRIIVYILAYHSTYCSISSITIEDLSAYIIGDTNLSDISVIENVEQIADTVKALPVYAPAGETTIQRNANYLSSADRSALDTIFDFEDEDYIGIPSLSFEYGAQIGQAVTAAIVYDSTDNEIDQNWIARAPAQSTASSLETIQTVNQVLTADASQADAQTELKQRIANDLAFVNPRPVLNVDLMDGFRWMIPSVYQWWTHTIPTTLTARERAYADTDRWWLQSISYTANVDDNTSALSATFIKETESTNAGIRPTLVPDVNALQLSFPPLSSGDFFIDDPLVNHPIDEPGFDYAFSADATVEPFPPGNNRNVEVGSDRFNVPFYTNKTVSTKRSTTIGQNYLVTCEGDAEIGNTWSVTFDFTVSDQGFAVVVNGDSQNAGTYVAGTGWQTQYNNLPPGIRSVGIGIAFTTNSTLRSAKMTYDLTNSGTWDGTNPDNKIQLRSPSDDLVATDAEFDGTGNDKSLSWSGSKALNNTREIHLVVFTGRKFGGGDPGGQATIKKLVISGTGSNPFGTGGGTRGDSFYIGYDVDGESASLYGSGSGLLIDGATPGGIPPYNPSHKYELVVAGTGSALAFRYVDSDYSDNSRNNITVTVTGDNMGLTA